MCDSIFPMALCSSIYAIYVNVQYKGVQVTTDYCFEAWAIAIWYPEVEAATVFWYREVPVCRSFQNRAHQPVAKCVVYKIMRDKDGKVGIGFK